jgi:hypothetical protein
MVYLLLIQAAINRKKPARFQISKASPLSSQSRVTNAEATAPTKPRYFGPRLFLSGSAF